MGAANTVTWYVVNSTVTVSSSRIEVLGTVNLILVDGKTFRAEKGLHVPSGVTLNIYGQSSGTGQLHSFSNTDQLAGIGGNNNQTGGTITIQGAAEGTPIAIYGIDGKEYGSTTSEKERTTIATSLQTGSVAIVKIGEKTVKVLVK